MPEAKLGDFFINAAAVEAGLSASVWQAAYVLFRHEIDKATKARDFTAHYDSYTFRVPSEQGSVDILVRCQPDPREAMILRFTAFPAENAAEVRQISRAYYFDGESRPVLGEAALLDVGVPW